MEGFEDPGEIKTQGGGIDFFDIPGGETETMSEGDPTGGEGNEEPRDPFDDGEDRIVELDPNSPKDAEILRMANIV